MDIEEDLKILQEFTELDRKLRNYKVESDYDNFCERRCVAIDNILAEREEDKKRMAELKKENERLKAKIDIENWQEKTVYESLKEKYIPKQKVKKVIEELKPINFDTADDREYTIRILKEFLEED